MIRTSALDLAKMILTGSGWQILEMILGWGFLGCLALSLWHFAHETVQVAQQLHQIPCSQCKFFTNSPVLKCTVHPNTALSEQAIHCPDFKNPQVPSPWRTD